MSEIYLPPESEKARGSVEISNGGDKMTGNRQEEKQAQGLLLHIGKLFVAGTAAGLVECIAAYPLDTVKTRMQTQARFTGPLHCFASTVREDGARALYRGMSSRVLAAMIAASVMFGVNGTLKQLLGADSKEPLTVPFLGAAAGTGVLEATVYCPLELVKTRMQVLSGSQKVSAWSTAVQIYRRYGITKGCYRGYSSLILREGLGNTVFFSSYELSKQSLVRDSAAKGPGVLTIAAAGGMAGMLYALAVQPIDSVKSLVQTDSMGAPKFRGFSDALVQSLANRGGGLRGFLGLYRGLTPALGRAFVGNAAMFLTFESAVDALGG